MGAEVEAHVWCDGPKSDPDNCQAGDQNEYGYSITAVRAFLRETGWVVRKRNGQVVDLCPTCKKG